ncbi:(S)-coclaurine-N-methyltransferase [Handroanthus impetiginosus]|uniref:(S)-coclaurine-N-methyltransferase n=1 Tax=Handroanthus impetiginosus TaxID=429701 RepID=A0A2G9HVP9_9LAMI|nr:(S)-coclaurine-N-methyltransferase [Handroanthus impetiginosus]
MSAVNGGIVDSIVQVPYDATVRLMLASLERNLLPDAVVRRFTRLLLASRLRSGYRSSADIQLADLLHFAHCTFAKLCHAIVI